MTPDRIGPYQVLGSLGEGGMGRVYLARQEHPVRRRVALKLLRVSFDSTEAHARFEAERHAMGRLDHPNVGLLLDAGSTEQGLPYFAMELIEGSPITEYADVKTLGLEERLRLMVDVCRGVEHAHRKLLLHRDIKPSNILIAELDRPVPKLIDFGIAKGLDQKPAEVTLATGGRLLGTPEYMSPEALGVGGEIDTRSDVFSLGVVLYELLTGVRPWTITGVSPMQRLRERIDQEAKRPSTGVSRLTAENAAEVASRRRLQPSALGARLRGDLDHIVMKAMAEQPGDRYATAAELGDDLERFLAHEPVSAQRPTTRYLIRKLIQRNRLAFTIGVAALLAVVLGIVTTSLAMVRAQEAERKARVDAESARVARDESEEVLRFLIQAFRGSGVIGQGMNTSPADRSARDILEDGAARIDEELAERPLVRARLKDAISNVYRQLGMLREAEQLATDAADLYQRFDAPDLSLQASSLINLASLELRLREIDDADAHAKGALDLLERSEEGQGRHNVALLRANAHLMLGRVERARGRSAESEELIKIAIAIFEAEKDKAGENAAFQDKVHLPIAINTLAVNFFRQGRLQEAEEQFRKVITLYEAILEPGAAQLAQAIDNLGAAIASQGRLQEAAPYFERSLAEQKIVLGDRHHKVAESLNNLGRLRFDLGGLTNQECASVLGVSDATIERDWKAARIWLRRELRR